MLLIMAFTANAGTGPQFQMCPSSPNCVEQESGSRDINPFPVIGGVDGAFARLKRVLSHRNYARIVSADDTIIRVEFRTFLGFVDDGLFVLNPENYLIKIRSAARTGYWDMGKNRPRLEDLRRGYMHLSKKTGSQF